MSEQSNVVSDGEVSEAEAFAFDLPTIYQIEVGLEDVITRTMASNMLSEGFIEVNQATHDAAMQAITSGPGAWYRDGVVVPMPAPPPPPIVLSAEMLFFDRMTPDEYDDLDASIAANERASTVRGWRNASSFTEGTAMWALLVKHLDLTVTAARRDEMLARP